MMTDICRDWTFSEPSRRPNLQLIPVNAMLYSDDDVELFNKAYQYCRSEIGESYFATTPSGGISTSVEHWRGPRWLIRNTTTLIELIVKDFDGCYFRLQIGRARKNLKQEGMISGRKAFLKFKEELQKDGVDLNEFKIDNGEEVKASIPFPLIQIFVPPGRTIENAHHLDLNSAYMAGIAQNFPEMRYTIERLYYGRHDKPVNKDVLNYAQGCFQSRKIVRDLRHCHIAKAGIDWTQAHVLAKAQELEEAHRRVIGFNTDGIWYQGDIYDASDHGSRLGEWKHDHTNCKLRYKSRGCYEFIEDGKYTPVFRGTSTYEKVVPRSEWAWGDIFQGDVIKYQFIPGKGIVKIQEDDDGILTRDEY